MGKFQCRTTVNGVVYTVGVEPRTILADFLRNDLHLKGTKVSCELQVCGACTVLVDGDPVSSCSYLAVDVHGLEVVTIEGLAGDGRLHPIQQAFIEHFAFQCGYCTPGFIMMTKALLEDSPDPSDDEISRYLEGNICRCTGYFPILAAVQGAARSIAGA